MNDNLAYAEDSFREPYREELIGGKWVAMAPATMSHNFVTSNIYFLFADYLRDKQCTPISDGAALYLSDDDFFIPDFMLVCAPDKIKWDGVHGAPDLVAEVLSPGTVRNDRGRKMRMYASSGVREYWLVNPADKVVEQYLLREGSFELYNSYALRPERELARMKPEELAAIQTEFKCSLYDDLTIRLADIFRRVP